MAEAWSNLLAGKSGIDLITKFDASNFACKIAGEVKGFELEQYIGAKEARTMDTFIHYGIAAAVQAVADAGLPTGEALSDERRRLSQVDLRLTFGADDLHPRGHRPGPDAPNIGRAAAVFDRERCDREAVRAAGFATSAGRSSFAVSRMGAGAAG